MSIEMDEEIKHWTAGWKSARVLDVIQGIIVSERPVSSISRLRRSSPGLTKPKPGWRTR